MHINIDRVFLTKEGATAFQRISCEIPPSRAMAWTSKTRLTPRLAVATRPFIGPNQVRNPRNHRVKKILKSRNSIRSAA